MQSYDVYSENCPTRRLLDHVADKWAALILGRIGAAPVRFNQLQREVQGISQKVLSQALKRLQRDGLITRRAFATVPVTVEYAITPLGETLAARIALLREWAQANVEAVLEAQARYDAGDR